jgi:hypothetical protein
MSRKILLKRLPTTDPDRFVEVEVYYDEGGMSYFTGGFNKRGYYVAVQPVKLDGGFRSITAFSGTKALVEETKRFSARKLQEVALQALHLPVYRTLLNHVLAKGNIRLQDAAAQCAGPAETTALTFPEAQPDENRAGEPQLQTSPV